jgi:hypothetical protein
MLTAARISVAGTLFGTAIALGVTADLTGIVARRIGRLAKTIG